ncbi:MAG: 3-oxoacyl-ACP reductase FabG [Tropheryma whipplei]|nr:3-oxoacyl-ACP reductase FabG [Tropheryma whipplei]
MSSKRTVFITGGNRGIGRAIAEKFKSFNYNVAIGVRQPEAFKDAGCLAVECDVTVSSSLTKAFKEVEERFGFVDVAIANAGIIRDTLVLRMKEDDFQHILDTNLTGAWRLAKLASRSMMRNKFGRIVFISSVSAGMGGIGQTNYSASKAGMIGLARALTRELASFGITVNVVAPGIVQTGMISSIPDNLREELIQRVPIRRIGLPEEVANAVFWLSSDEASYVSGVVLPVDGGLSMGF